MSEEERMLALSKTPHRHLCLPQSSRPSSQARCVGFVSRQGGEEDESEGDLDHYVEPDKDAGDAFAGCLLWRDEDEDEDTKNI
jgi:hypothetical protein